MTTQQLDPLALGRLRLSVGYNTHKKGRPLSPIEVGLHFRRFCDAGVSIEGCAEKVGLDKTNVARFLRILELPKDIQHLIAWGSSSDSISFTSAFEIAAIKNEEEQRCVVRAVLQDGLKGKEIRQVVQLRRRSGKLIEECIEEILGMRPKRVRRYVFVGAMAGQQDEANLAGLTQIERDKMLQEIISTMKLSGGSGRLGDKFFTLVGGDEFGKIIGKVGKEELERKVRYRIREALKDGRKTG